MIEFFYKYKKGFKNIFFYFNIILKKHYFYNIKKIQAYKNDYRTCAPANYVFLSCLFLVFPHVHNWDHFSLKNKLFSGTCNCATFCK